jgi:uncharacterized protein YidB (DUF937 family)
MGMLDGLVGGAMGAVAVNAVQKFIQSKGGVQAIAAQFQQHGLGDTVKSWIGTGPNLPVSPDQLHQVLGADVVQQLATKLGMNPQEVLGHLSTLLPHAVDQMTPNGVVPPASAPA